MKKILCSIIALMGVLGAQAQQTWDFTKTDDADVAALKAATTEWTYDEKNDRYSNVDAINGRVMAGNTELNATKGLLVSGAAAGKLKIDVNKRIQLGGKNISITTPTLTKGQTVTIVFASTGTTACTFDELTNLSNAQGFIDADKNTEQKGTATVTADGTISFKSTKGSINIFSITVSDAATPAPQVRTTSSTTP